MNRDILIISNNHTNRIAYAGALMGYGHDVAETPNFADAKALLSVGVLPCAIIIDLKLSSAQAGAFIDDVRHQPGGDDVNIVVIGGNADEAKTVSSVGASLFLHRPVDVNTLLDTVHSGAMQPTR